MDGRKATPISMTSRRRRSHWLRSLPAILLAACALHGRVGGNFSCGGRTLPVSPTRCSPQAANSRLRRNWSPKSKPVGDADVAIIVPGLLYGADSYEPLCKDLAAKGYKAAVVPMDWWHWVPCLGGRCMRPILERIDYTVDYVLANGPSASIPSPSYSLSDFVDDFMNNPGGVLKVGGSGEPDEYPAVEPSGDDFTESARKARTAESSGSRVALVGHSAGGWISRIFLSDRLYAGRVYNAIDRVHSLVTLGSPHSPAPGIAFKALEWLAKGGQPASVRCLAVGSKGIVGGESSDFTKNAYKFCGGEAPETDGDGVTPLFSALDLPGAEKLALQGLTHASEYPPLGPTAELSEKRSSGQPWYGDAAPLEMWLAWLKGES